MKFFTLLSLYFLFITFPLQAKERWLLNTELSSVNFELPLLIANNIKGEFKEISGLVEIDLETKKNNKAIFSVNVESIDINYNKYKNLLLSKIFFDSQVFPIALVDTKKFSYQNENKLNLKVDLIIKGITHTVPLSLEIIFLAKELIQIKGEIKFSRTSFQIGTGQWSNTYILKDEAKINVNLFLFKD